MSAEFKTVLLESLKRICPACGRTLDRYPAMQVFFAVLIPIILFLCLVVVAFSPLRNKPLLLLLFTAFMAGALIALQTIHAKIIRPGLQRRFATMILFVEKELAGPGHTLQRPEWEAYARKMGLSPWDFLDYLESGSEYQQGLRALLGQRYDDAISLFERITKAEQVEKARANLFLGNVFLTREHYQEALAAYERSTDMDMESVPAWSGKGRCLTELGRHKEALEALNKAIELDPKVPAVWKCKGESLQKIGRHREALQALEKAIGLNRPGDAETWKLKGISLGEIGHFREALDAFTMSIEMDPGNAAAWKHKGAALVNLGRNKDAREAFDHSLGLNPRDGETWKYKGVALENLDRHGEAVEAYRKAMELNPRDADAWKCQGVLFLDTKQYENALAAFDHLPAGYERWKYRGMALAELHRYDEASIELERAEEEKPEQAEIWYWKAQLLQRTDRFKEAILAYHHAIGLKPDHAESWENIAAIMTRLGRNQDAVNALDKARQITESRKK
jgi:tetratricopeptide (TPR) repeat protein